VKTVNIHEAKTHFSRLLRRVAAGEDVVISKAGRPVARLVPLARSKGERVLGSQRGKFVVPEDFDAPLPEEILAEFER
jgi:prevent-host-death family protein